MKMVRKRATGYLVQDMGLILFLLCVGIMAFTVGNAGSGLMFEFVILLLGTFLAILLAGFKLISLSVVTVGFEILVYTAYKIFEAYAYSNAIDALCYVWILVPVISVASMYMFVYGSRQTEMENDVLREQVEELVMINSLTGLYNLRSLYMDLQKQAAYAERNNISLCLMIVQIRYEQELKNILSRSHYEAMIQKMANIIVDTVRVEDRVYSLDNKGTVGIMLTCDKEGSESAKNRIRSRIEEKDAFKGITDSSINVEIRIACLQYDKEQIGTDMILFKQRVENELQYDV